MEDKEYQYKTEQVSIAKLALNTGQILDVPSNPRFIRDNRYKALVKSIKDNPKMLELREPIAYDNNGELVVIAGNMRIRACKELGIKELKVKIVDNNTSSRVIREIIIKDNLGYGEDDWDMLNNEWEVKELQDWGVELPFKADDIDFDNIENTKDRESSKKTKEFTCPSCSYRFEV